MGIVGSLHIDDGRPTMSDVLLPAAATLSGDVMDIGLVQIMPTCNAVVSRLDASASVSGILGTALVEI